MTALFDRFSAKSSEYRTADPFPHAIFENLFDPTLLASIVSEFPDPHEMSRKFVGDIEGGKSSENDILKFGPITQQFFFWMSSAPVLHALEGLTGIRSLLPDPYLSGGGLHQTTSGGRLKIHADFNVHSKLNLIRRLNLLVYLNTEWNSEWGGQLELWDSSMSKCVKSVEPRFGTVVIFDTSQTSFHGLPDPLRCPDSVTRKSLAFYFYTSEGTIPDKLSTQFRPRPGEYFEAPPVSRFRLAGSHLRRALATLLRN